MKKTLILASLVVSFSFPFAFAGNAPLPNVDFPAQSEAQANLFFANDVLIVLQEMQIVPSEITVAQMSEALDYGKKYPQQSPDPAAIYRAEEIIQILHTRRPETAPYIIDITPAELASAIDYIKTTP